jgi:CelD/BcsL family acetyltransferase involved in cellulose biosynthesis
LLVATASERDQATSTSLVRLAPEDGRWLDFLAQSPAALPFHHPSWARVLTESYGHPSFVLALADEHGRLHGGMPVMEIRRRLRRPRWVSLPFTDRCPPLATDEAMCARLVNLADLSRADAGIASLEVHADLPSRHVHRQARGVSHVLSLSSDPELTFRRFSRSQVQRNIVKGERSGLTLRRADSTEDLTISFYGLHVRTRRRLGIPVQPRYFFDHLWRHVIAPERGFLLLAYSGSVPVAGAVFLTLGRTIVYKFGASEPSFWPLRPNHLLFSDAIRWSCETGFATFDFGRSEFDNRGLRSFKSGWGAIEEPLLYATLGADPPRVGRLVGNSLVTPLIRRGPLWLCRAIGEVAYPRIA